MYSAPRYVDPLETRMISFTFETDGQQRGRRRPSVRGIMIRRGISIYSFQEKYYRGEMSLEDCLATTAKMGVRGFEMLSDQMIPGYPSITYNLSAEFLDSWRGWLEKYGVEPVAFDVYGETKLYKNRKVTNNEVVSELRELLKTAQALGFKILRLTFH